VHWTLPRSFARHARIVVDRCQYGMVQAFQMSRKVYTTVQVAKAANVPRATLQFWIASGKISAPGVRLIEGRAVRLWSEADLERVRNLKGTLKSGPKSSKKKK
jgi:hypothetical protein